MTEIIIDAPRPYYSNWWKIRVRDIGDSLYGMFEGHEKRVQIVLWANENGGPDTFREDDCVFFESRELAFKAYLRFGG